jgi:hypothetical protein
MFPPQGAAQSAPREAAARSVRMTRAVTLLPPTPKNFFLYRKATGALGLFFGFTHFFAMWNVFAMPDVVTRVHEKPKGHGRDEMGWHD